MAQFLGANFYVFLCFFKQQRERAAAKRAFLAAGAAAKCAILAAGQTNYEKH